MKKLDTHLIAGNRSRISMNCYRAMRGVSVMKEAWRDFSLRTKCAN